MKRLTKKEKQILQAIKQHVAFGAPIEILNYKQDYVGIQYSKSNGYYMLAGDIHVTYNGVSTGKSVKDFRFLLRPLSQLTEEIEHNGERFVPIIELFKLRTQVTGDKIADYYIENNTAILRLEAQHLDEYEFRAFFEIDLKQNDVMFSIATETWKDEVMIREDVNLCGNEMTMFEKLHEWHFDTKGLLDRGLALPIDGKEVEGGNE